MRIKPREADCQFCGQTFVKRTSNSKYCDNEACRKARLKVATTRAKRPYKRHRPTTDTSPSTANAENYIDRTYYADRVTDFRQRMAQRGWLDHPEPKPDDLAAIDRVRDELHDPRSSGKWLTQTMVQARRKSRQTVEPDEPLGDWTPDNV